MKTCPQCSGDYDDSVKVCPADKSALKSVEKDALVGITLANRYKVESILGRGGMGVVYRAQDEQTDRIVAIKMLHSHKVADSEALKRFNREARTVAQVNHHHIVTLYDFGMSKTRQPYLVMDFIQGKSLKDEMAIIGAFPFDRASKIFEQVLDALEYAHSKDVVHRDLKPENIILAQHGGEPDFVKIVDFGLSKLKDNESSDDLYQITKAGDVCGSPPYMSPEQCLSNSVVDPRSDIYSMAIMCYEVLSGKLPYKAKSAIEMMDCHLYGAPIPFCDASPELRSCNETTYVLKKALSKEPEARHQSCSEFLKELKDALRRDWPKVRSYRFRLEDVSYKDLESEAEALETGEHPALDLSYLANAPSPVQAIINEFKTETAVHKEVEQHPVVREEDPMEEEKQGGEGFLTKILSFFKRQETTGDEDDDYGYVEDLGYTHCPFCAAPVKARLRFCVNCQRQLPSVQEFSKLRMGGGKFALGKSPGMRANIPQEPKGFSKRAKVRSASPGMSTFQKLVTLLLVGGLFYYGYNSYQKDPQVKKKVDGFVNSVKKQLK